MCNVPRLIRSVSHKVGVEERSKGLKNGGKWGKIARKERDTEIR